MVANYFVVKGLTPNGEEYEKKFNSYYLAVIEKGELIKQGYDVKVFDPDVVWLQRGGVKYNNVERRKFKKFKKTYQDEMKKHRPLRSNYKVAIGEGKHSVKTFRG